MNELIKRYFKMTENKPIKTYRAGVLSLSYWEKELESGKAKTFSFQRSYKDKAEKWQHTQTLTVQDLPKLKVLIEEAYKEQILNETENEMS